MHTQQHHQAPPKQSRKSRFAIKYIPYCIIYILFPVIISLFFILAVFPLFSFALFTCSPDAGDPGKASPHAEEPRDLVRPLWTHCVIK